MSRIQQSTSLSRLLTTRRTPTTTPIRVIVPRSRRILLQPNISKRFQSSNVASPPSPSNPTRRIRPVYIFLGVMSVGVFFTIYGILGWYFALDIWPDPVRTPLRRAIKAKNQGDSAKAEQHFREAITIAESLPPSLFAPDPLLKMSGLYIALAGMLEKDGHLLSAYQSLHSALEHFGPDPLSSKLRARISGPWTNGVALSTADHTRAIAITQKMGHLALKMTYGSTITTYPTSPEPNAPKSWIEAAERHLSSSLTAMLKLGVFTTPSNGPVVVGRDISLPQTSNPENEPSGGSIDRKGLGATMEALAEVYAKQGQHALAGQLLIQAVSTLLPPQMTESPPVQDQCLAAMLMTTISSHALHPNTPSAIKASKSWSLRALQIASEAITSDGADSNSIPNCQRATCVGLYNLGMLAELEKDFPAALKRFSQAFTSARDSGFLEGKRQASDAIRRVRANHGADLVASDTS